MNRLAVIAAVLLAGCVTTDPVPVREASPRDAAQANLRLGSEYLQRGDADRALDRLLRAVEQDPGLAPAHAYLGLTYEQLSQVKEADKHYRAAVRLAKDDPSVHNMYAVYLCRRERLAEADKYFQSAIAIPTYTTPEIALTNAGACKLKVPDVAAAEAYFREALNRNPRYADALWRMARLTHEADRAFQTRAFLQRLAEVAPLPAPALWLGYRVERRLGDERAATRYAEQLMQNFPESIEARELHNVDERY